MHAPQLTRLSILPRKYCPQSPHWDVNCRKHEWAFADVSVAQSKGFFAMSSYANQCQSMFGHASQCKAVSNDHESSNHFHNRALKQTTQHRKLKDHKMK